MARRKNKKYNQKSSNVASGPKGPPEFWELSKEEQAKAISKSLAQQKIRGPVTYPESEVAAMSPEEKADLHALNVKEAIETARGGASRVPQGMVKAAPGGLPAITKKLEKAENEKSKAEEELKEALNKNAKAADANAKAADANTKEDKELNEQIKKQLETHKLLTKKFDALLGSTKSSDKKPSIFSLKGFLDMAGISKSMGPLGRIFHEKADYAEEQKQFVKIGKMREPESSPSKLKSKFKEMKSEQRNLSKALAERDEMRAGGMTDEEIEAHSAKQKGGGIVQRIKESSEKLMDLVPGAKSPKEKTAKQNNVIVEKATGTDGNTANAEEVMIDQNKMIEEQTELLKEIRDNTAGPGGSKVEKGKKPAESETEGLFSGIMKSLGQAFSNLFSPMNIIKALGKIAFVTYIVTSVVKGFIDGWEEFQKSGDIMKALVTGLEGFFEVLTLGLLPKDSLTKIGEWIGDKMFDIVNDISEYISNIFGSIGKSIDNLMNDFMNMIGKIGLPRIEFDVPVIGKVGIGPFFPFKSDATNTAKPVKNQSSEIIANQNVAQAKPQTANQLIAKSEENEAAKNNQNIPASSVAVNAPTINNKTEIIQPRRSAFNTDSAIRGSTGLLASVYA